MSIYKVTDTELTSVANAIRTKGDTSGQLTFPDGFVTAIGNISGGGGFTPADEGKVVSNGALVTQGSQTITQNGTYDTTLISELIANISGGGGGSTNILSGTDIPTASVGSDGDVYIKYTDYTEAPTGTTFLRSITTQGGNKNNGFLTDVPFTSNTKIRMDCKIYSNVYAAWHGLIGVRNTSPVYMMYARASNNAIFAIEHGSVGSVSTTQNTAIYDRNISILLTANGASYTDNFNSYNISSNPSLPTSGNIYFFGTDFTGAQTGESGKYTVYGIEISENDTLIHRYIPAIDSNDVVGMYDTVDKEFVYPINSTWIAGEEASGTPIDKVYLKVNGAWIIIEDGDLDDVNTGGDTPKPVDDWTALTDYIESSGTQYIDTGYSVQSDTRIEVVANVPDNIERYPTIFGARTEVADECVIFAEFNSGNIAMVWANGDEPFVPTFWGRGYINKKCNYVLGGGGEISIKDVDGNGFVGNRTVGTPASIPLYLFVLNESGSPNSITFCSMKLYRFRIYEEDTLVHEFIPWTDSNDVVCLKDTVTSNLKYNAGTGVFTYGTDEQT